MTHRSREEVFLGISEAAFSNEAGGCTQRARAAHREHMGLKCCRDLLVTVIVVDHCKDQGADTSGFLDGCVASSRKQDVPVGSCSLSTQPGREKR